MAVENNGEQANSTRKGRDFHERISARNFRTGDTPLDVLPLSMSPTKIERHPQPCKGNGVFTVQHHALYMK